MIEEIKAQLEKYKNFQKNGETLYVEDKYINHVGWLLEVHTIQDEEIKRLNHSNRMLLTACTLFEKNSGKVVELYEENLKLKRENELHKIPQ